MSKNNQNSEIAAKQGGQSANHCYTEFIEKFGKFSCPENCKIQNLPFIKDIEIFLNSIDSNNALYELQDEV